MTCKITQIVIPVAVVAFVILTSFSAKHVPPLERDGGPFFVLLEAHLPYRNHSGTQPKESVAQMTGAGVCVLDYDLDGDWDVYFPNGASPDAPDATNQLFRNRGGLEFEDVTVYAGVGDRGWSGGCAVGDIDNDGDPDLYVTIQGGNTLFGNNGDGTFTRLSSQAGVDDEGWGTSAAFADLDADGLLDLYVCNYLDLARCDLEARCPYYGIEVYCGPYGLPGAADVLYRNENGLRFRDMTESSGVLTLETRGFSVLISDLNGDRLPDIHVANDGNRDLLFVNRGNFLFEDVSLISGAAYASTGMEQAGMGTTGGDYDRDGDIDLYVTNFQRDYNTLFRNEGGLLFSDVTVDRGLGMPTLAHLGWGTHFFDADNDGALDIFVANGHIYAALADHPEINEPYHQNNQLFLGDGKGKFTEVQASQVEPIRSSRGTALADLDGDGALDVLVNNIDDFMDLYHGAAKGNWIRFGLIGVESNRDGVGAVITVKAGELWQQSELRLSDGYEGSNEPILHFGLGKALSVDEVTIVWPSGREERISKLSTGRLYRVKEGVGCLP